MCIALLAFRLPRIKISEHKNKRISLNCPEKEATYREIKTKVLFNSNFAFQQQNWRLEDISAMFFKNSGGK